MNNRTNSKYLIESFTGHSQGFSHSSLNELIGKHVWCPTASSGHCII